MFGGFGDIFGGRSRTGPQKGDHIRTGITISFEEAAFGCSKELSVSKVETCESCNGLGSAPGTSPETCPDCRGTGTVRQQQRAGFMSFSTSGPCPKCGGTGKLIRQPCQSCQGRGTVRRPRKISVNIPAGIDDGQTISLRGLGNAGTSGGPSGDLLVTVGVRRHSTFERDGTSVLSALNISFVQAALGAQLEIPTLDGPVSFDIPEGTQAGTVFRLRGHGIPSLRGGGRGDHFVTVKVETPHNLSQAQKELLRQFGETLDGEEHRGLFDRKKKKKSAVGNAQLALCQRSLSKKLCFSTRRDLGLRTSQGNALPIRFGGKVHTMKKTLGLLLAGFFLLGAALPLPAEASAPFSDVPAASWASDVIDDAVQGGLMEGVGGGAFGYGQSVTRAQFVTVLCRMFGWELQKPQTPTYTDVTAGSWAYPYVETALINGVLDAGAAFRPDDPILRREMAVMLVRALGYAGLAKAAGNESLPFTDVSRDQGYIKVAYDIGMTSGTSATTFEPEATARREEAAAMLVRVHNKLQSGTDWLHGFYAFSSWPQHELTRQMDAVSAGWSRLSLDADKGILLNTTSSGGNEWCIPSSYEDITAYLEEGGTPLHLDVYLDGGSAGEILLSEENRAAAVAAILAETTRSYDAIGKNPYAGVTLDFEGLWGAALKEGYNAFLRTLSSALKADGKSLYVAVQPATAGEYYDGYDYRTIGELADKVILMAHDYNATDLSGFEGTSYYKTAALTPIADVYYSLQALTDPVTGVADREKLALAVSFTGMAWEIRDGLLVSPTPVYPSIATIYSRLKQADTVLGWSEEYQNPWATYNTESGQSYFLWYEDARSAAAKLRLARLFGINGVSVWRLGNIPAYDDTGLYYNAWEALQ
jgi:chaperone protein DnaJ